MTGPSPRVVRLTLACGLWQFAVLWLTKPLTSGGETWVPTVGAHIITLVIVLLVGAALWRNESRHRRPPEQEPVDDPTEYLTDADREWLTGHGWEPPAQAPLLPPAQHVHELRDELRRERDGLRQKRATWQTSLDREIGRHAEPLRVRVESTTRRHYAVRIETGTNRRQRSKYLRD